MGALETYIAGYANNLPFNIEDPDYNAWVDWINSVGDGSAYESIPMMPTYLETAKSSIVRHGLKALNLSLTGTKDCVRFMVALQDTTATADKGKKDRDSTEATPPTRTGTTSGAPSTSQV